MFAVNYRSRAAAAALVTAASLLSQPSVEARELRSSDVVVSDDARPGVERRTVRIGYGDLDLASPEGVARLERRVKYAARLVCPHSGAFTRIGQERRCRNKAVADAGPALRLAIIRSRGGERLATAGEIRMAQR